MILTAFGPASSRVTSITFTVLLACVVFGCAGPGALRSSYVAYSDTFATASNQQLLLNLARLRNGHPPHFLQMGGVTAQFSFNGGLNSAYTDAKGDITRNVGVSLGASESPVFNFTPLSGAAYSKILLTPFDPKVLYSFINQNMPVSLTLRLLVDRISLKYPNGTQAVFRNRISREHRKTFGDYLRLTKLFERLHEKDLLGVESSDSGDVRFSLSDRAHSEMRRYATEDPRLELLTYNLWSDEGAPIVEVKTRSFMDVLINAAYESGVFDQLPEPYLASLPEGEREPVLRIDEDPTFTEPVAAEVKYAGKRYVISDKAGSNHNRVSFTLLQLLASQTQLDPSQLPTQQLIQVR